MNSMPLMCLIGALYLSFSFCQQVLSGQIAADRTAPIMRTEDETGLVKDVKTFTVDVGPEGEKAWARLRSVPRAELVGRLVALRGRLPADDAMQPRIAFVLCNLDYEYPANASIVAAALARHAQYRNFGGDDAAGLLARLIERGDQTLLPVLLRSAAWADGALAEQLSDTIADRLVKDTDALLVALRVQRQQTRARIYRFISAEGTLNREDRQTIRNRLRRITPKNKVYPIAQELLTTALRG
jgi:hypothetical protein